MPEPGAPEIPEQEQRGGETPDWARAQPGKPLPQKPEEPPAPAPGPGR